MWADKLLARATIKEYDEILLGTILTTGESSVNKEGNPNDLSKAEKHANNLNKKAYNKLILSCSDKISFGTVKSAKNQVHPKGDAKEA